jgi:hypothetical protein
MEAICAPQNSILREDRKIAAGAKEIFTKMPLFVYKVQK